MALLNSTDIINAALCIGKIPESVGSFGSIDRFQRLIKDLLDKIHDLFASELIEQCDIHQMLTDPGYFEDLTLQEQFSSECRNGMVTDMSQVLYSGVVL